MFRSTKDQTIISSLDRELVRTVIEKQGTFVLEAEAGADAVEASTGSDCIP